jgi:calcineurin-like phosphoesterase family protein
MENWNRFIQPGDTVFHLGDLALAKRAWRTMWAKQYD